MKSGWPCVGFWFMTSVLFLLTPGCSEKKPSPPAPSDPAYRAVGRDEFFSNYHVATLRITVAGTNLNSLQTNHRAFVHATLQEGHQIWTDVALHLKGSEVGSFRPFEDKPSLTLNMDKFRPGQEYHGLDKFYLNNSVEDPRFMTEALCAQLFRDAGVPAPRVTHVRVILNEQGRGLYVLKEGWDKSFLRQWFKNPNGNLYDSGLVYDIDQPLIKNSGDTSETQTDLDAVVAATKIADFSERWEKLQQLVDMPRFLSFMAMEILTAHRDGYCLNQNNYRVYADPQTGKVVFMPHGMDIMFSITELSINPPMKGLLAKAIMEVPLGHDLYRDRLAFLVTNVLREDVLLRQINELQRRISPLLESIDPTKMHPFDVAVDDLRLAISKRRRSVMRQLEERGEAVSR